MCTIHDNTVNIYNADKPGKQTLREYIVDRSEPDNGHNKDKKEQLNLEIEAERLKTFKEWSNGAVTPESLAQAGFYATNQGDTVKCAFCSTEGSEWKKGDVPMDDHKDWSPHCPFVRLNSTTSTSSSSSASTSSEESLGRDVCGYKLSESLQEKQAYKILRELGIEQTRPSSYESYSTLESRLRSYEDWPKSLKQRPDVLSEAGFFYKGIGDQTMCFHCGGGLKDWDVNDDPWEQHALWFPNCSFLLLQKGQGFVKDVAAKFNGACATKDEGNGVEKPVVENPGETPVEKPVECSKEVDLGPEANSSTLCKICFKKEMGVVFIPCGHVVSCVDCVMSLKGICPVCRQKFHGRVRAFLA